MLFHRCGSSCCRSFRKLLAISVNPSIRRVCLLRPACSPTNPFDLLPSLRPIPLISVRTPLSTSNSCPSRMLWSYFGGTVRSNSIVLFQLRSNSSAKRLYHRCRSIMFSFPSLESPVKFIHILRQQIILQCDAVSVHMKLTGSNLSIVNCPFHFSIPAFTCPIPSFPLALPVVHRYLFTYPHWYAMSLILELPSTCCGSNRSPLCL